ncbi:MAG: hypothetical protein IPO14_03320 [Saprospiraceae bacterium]|nr:hypothetical protein [Saprospiraceae bacterium]
MKYIIFIIFYFCANSISFDCRAQNCTGKIKESQVVGTIHFLSTNKVFILKRPTYSYQISFISDGEGVSSEITSLMGDRLEFGDEIIFQDNGNKRLNFYFVDHLNKSNSTQANSTNKIRLTMDDLKWLISGEINAFYVKKGDQKEMKKFTLLAENSADLVYLGRCFMSSMDVEKVEQVSNSKSKLISFQSKENSASNSAGNSGSFSKPGGPGQGSTADPEVADLRKQLADLKLRLREEIKIESEKDEKMKAQLVEDLSESRRKANEQKNVYSQEIIEARKKSLDEIEKIRKEQSNFLQAQKNNFSNEAQRLDSVLMARRTEIALEIEKAKLLGEEKILAIRKQTESEILEIQKSKTGIKQEYADEIANARSAANTELLKIREETAEQMKNIQAMSAEFKNKNANDVDFSQKSAGEKIRTIMQETAQIINEIREKNVLEKERLATELATIILKNGEEIAKVAETQSRQVALLRENFENEKNKIATDIQLAREKGAEKVVQNNENLEQIQKKQNEAIVRTKAQADSAMAVIHKQNAEYQSKWLQQIENQRKKADSVKTAISNDAIAAKQKMNLVIESQRKSTDSTIMALKNKELVFVQKNARFLDSLKRKLAEDVAQQEKAINLKRAALGKSMDSSAVAYKKQLDKSIQNSVAEEKKIEDDKRKRITEIKAENKNPANNIPQKEAGFNKEAAAEDIATARKEFTQKKLSLEKDLLEMQKLLNDSILRTQLRSAERLKLLTETYQRDQMQLQETMSRREDSMRNILSEMQINHAEEVNRLKMSHLSTSDSLTQVISHEKQKAQQEIMKNFEMAAEEVETIKIQKEEAIKEEDQKYQKAKDSLSTELNQVQQKYSVELEKLRKENLVAKEKLVLELQNEKTKIDKYGDEERKKMEEELTVQKKTITEELKTAKDAANKEFESVRTANTEKLDQLLQKIKEEEANLKNIQDEVRKAKKE